MEPFITLDTDIFTAVCASAGSTFLGAIPLSPEPEFPRFQAWLDAGKAADMHYLHTHQQLRADPRGLLTGAQSVLLFGLVYGPSLPSEPGPRCASYAEGKDYHRRLWSAGTKIWQELCILKPQLAAESFRVLADSAPLMERALVARSGAGFIGKNTCFIRPGVGSFLLLGELITSADLGQISPHSVASKARSNCGTCRRCQSHCPTNALNADYQLDARRCLAYWTIEHRGLIPREFWPHLGKYWYGCDICQNVCPCNRVTPKTNAPTSYDLFTVATMDQTTYLRLFAGSAMTRAKIHGLRRNALLALYVTKDARWEETVQISATDPDPIISGTSEAIREAFKEGFLRD